MLPDKIKEIAAELAGRGNLLGDLRNGLGGHVRPGEATAGLRTHKDWTAIIVRNTKSSYATSYRQFTQIAPLFVWAEVTGQDTFASKHEALATAIPRAVGALLAGIDGLLQAFWTDLPDSRMAIPSEVEGRLLGGRNEQVSETKR